MALNLIRRGGSIDKSSSHGYSVSISIGYEGEFQAEIGFTGISARFLIPADIGDKMTVDELYAEAYRRFDSVKHLF